MMIKTNYELRVTNYELNLPSNEVKGWKGILTPPDSPFHSESEGTSATRS